jgi:hypothetical protein
MGPYWTKGRVPLEVQRLLHFDDLLCHLFDVIVEFNHECFYPLALRVHRQSLPLLSSIMAVVVLLVIIPSHPTVGDAPCW